MNNLTNSKCRHIIIVIPENSNANDSCKQLLLTPSALALEFIGILWWNWLEFLMECNGIRNWRSIWNEWKYFEKVFISIEFFFYFFCFRFVLNSINSVKFDVKHFLVSLNSVRCSIYFQIYFAVIQPIFAQIVRSMSGSPLNLHTQFFFRLWMIMFDQQI